MKLIKVLDRKNMPMLVNAEDITYVFTHKRGNTSIDFGNSNFSAASGESIDTVVAKMEASGIKVIKLTLEDNANMEAEGGSAVYVNVEKIRRIATTRGSLAELAFASEDVEVKEDVEEVLQIIAATGIGIEQF